MAITFEDRVPVACNQQKYDADYCHKLTIKVKLAEENRLMSGRPKVILHEADGFPLDNYGRYLYDHIVPGTQVHTFYSKNLQHSYSNRNRPCQSGLIEVLGQTYNYDQTACQWKKTCEHLYSECGCFCPLEFLRALDLGVEKRADKLQSIYPELQEHCIHRCFYDTQLMLVDTAMCPYACDTTTYSKLNEVRFPNATSLDSIEVNYIQDDAITQKTEEELFGLAKLFSEVGGLSSFFFGFSCLVIFQLLELCSRLLSGWARKRNAKRQKILKLRKLTRSILFSRGAASGSHCLPGWEDSPILPYKTMLRMSSIDDKPGPSGAAECDLSVWIDVDGTLMPVSVE
ncbi:unnamed protein product [Mesocestoides corti]|uniref:Uncharacterized protein n=2 Tax=Mesocestoides corti TaxID=53468 RepID=A0A0R3UDW2_MESCO|nr:unnamed protein product [Mesocestoides corti]